MDLLVGWLWLLLVAINEMQWFWVAGNPESSALHLQRKVEVVVLAPVSCSQTSWREMLVHKPAASWSVWYL